ncbi:MAG: hydrogenase nickel incorporation protein HypA [Sulfolobales archaeon]|nr:hydrogenase nickel incorporation protein HypA [Sulfolobales archaeon]MCX8209304.1 hydrogenase nickel incorporation protein HypA [Sulfolobales archaeon]MDW8010605.1 hydrogenase nickel incorporation protein HypA [Sulfolobales archaeon]
MHEWALAEAITVALLKQSELRGSKSIKRLVVGLGELQAIDREIFEFALSEVLKLYGLEVREYALLSEEAEFECGACGHSWKLRELELSDEVREAIHFLPEAAYSYVKCPRCGSRDFSVVRGRGVSIVGVEY